ncbi:GNAT family N-acetyltransferase [bacterium]|nr:GNAT family N-acetyltransferase [bacterium]
MCAVHYSNVYEKYLFRKDDNIVTPRQTIVAQMETLAAGNFLSVSPRIVMDLKASWRRCIIKYDPQLMGFINSIPSLPYSAHKLLELGMHILLEEYCRREFSAQSYELLADQKFYCTPRILKKQDQEGICEVTSGNIDEILHELVPGIADKPEYVTGGDILSAGPAFAWYQNGKPVGFAGTHSSYMSERVGNIGMVFVTERYRGNGAAKRLVAAVADRLLKAGRMPVYGCSVYNPASIKTALGAGFKLAGYTIRLFIPRGV